MFKKGFFYIALVFTLGLQIGCSSSGDSGEDLDISEIKEIETTGEFSEDEFFSADDGLDTKETELVEEVADLEESVEGISDEVADLEDGLSDELELEEDTTDDVAALEGSDILDELDSDELDLDEGASIGTNQDVTVSAADLGFDEGEEDLFEGESSGDDQQNVAAASEDELDLDSEDDLFREDSADILSLDEDNTGVDEFAEASDDELDLDTDTESAQIADVDLPNDIGTDQSAAQMLSEDEVSIDVDYSQDSEFETAAAPKKTYVSVKKMQTVPYSKNGVLVNAIYFVRAGDTLASIGDKIYGNGSAVDFKIVNPHLKPNALKVGQKVYYNSPYRSQDRSRLLTFYEDQRVPAQIYSASAGENIRKISENLLGHPRSWMEVWASNQQIQEKWSLESPYQIRYWKGQPQANPILAKTTPPAPKPTPQPVAVIPKVEPPAPVEVAVREETTSQASLDQTASDEDIFDEPVLAEDEPLLDEPDMELDEPAQVAGQVDEDLFEEDLLDEPTGAVAANNQQPSKPAKAEVDQFEATAPAVAAVDGRGIARNKGGGFQAKAQGLMQGDMMRKGILGAALFLLLAVGFLVVRRRRQSQNAVEMESFDFGGETAIDDAQDKTQIDL